MKNSRIVEMVMVDTRLIRMTNSEIDEVVVDEICKEGLDALKLGVLPALRQGNEWIITDGNHRVAACKKLGVQYVPIAELTQEEFDYVKGSNRTVDLAVKLPEKPKYYTAGGRTIEL